MALPDDLIQQRFNDLRTEPYGTRFYKVDLHFHTPSSSDGRGRDKYGFNPYAISFLSGDQAASADLLADIKGLNSLEPLRDRADLRQLELKDIAALEQKILHDMLLLQDLKALQAGKSSKTRKELEARLRQAIESIDDLKQLTGVDFKFLEREEIKALSALRTQQSIDLLAEALKIQIQGFGDLEGKYFDLRLLRDLRYLQDQVSASGYPGSLREFHDRILAYARVKAAQIVERFFEEKLDIVAITDHNGMGTLWSDGDCMDLAAPTWYELIDDAAQEMNMRRGTKLVILPGVEISTEGIHILAIFPRQNPRRKVHYMISDLVEEAGILPEEWCINKAVGNVSPYGVIELIKRKGGIAIPAHIDGDDKALLERYELTGGALENVVAHPHLRAVEVIDPDLFREGATKTRLDQIRRENDLPSLAYFQGSDSHDLLNIAKRCTILKMTEPAYEGLQTAMKMASSRVRFSSDRKEWDGLYLRGITFDHPLLGRQTLRFNRNLNCICGKVGAGKTTLHNLMRAAVHPEHEFPTYSETRQGYVSLFMEKVEETGEGDASKKKFGHYAYYRKADQRSVSLYSLEVDAEGEASRPSRLVEITSEANPSGLVYEPGQIDGQSMKEHIQSLDLQPKFYDVGEIKTVIDDQMKLKTGRDNLFQEFLFQHLGRPAGIEAAAKIVRDFNRMFVMPQFLEKSPEQTYQEITVKKAELVKAEENVARALAAFEASPKTKVDRAALKKVTGEQAKIERELARAQSSQLLELAADTLSDPVTFRLALNLNWRTGPADLRDFFSLSESQRKTVLMCLTIMCSELPIIIDAPEQEFDNEDMARYLVPLILENKETRQILLFTNHPILAVNTDPDNYLLLQRKILNPQALRTEPVKTEVVFASGFAIDAPPGQRELLLEILEGDLRLFRKRASRYE